MSRYRLSPGARTDIREIRGRIARDRPSRAISFIDELVGTFRLLCASPLIGRQREELWAGLRSFTPDNYMIFYRLIGPDIDIVRVIHGRRDLGRIFDH